MEIFKKYVAKPPVIEEKRYVSKRKNLEQISHNLRAAINDLEATQIMRTKNHLNSLLHP